MEVLQAPKSSRTTAYLSGRCRIYQARAAILFLYRRVLEVEPGSFEGLIRARRTRRLPVVLSREEVKRVLDQVEGAEGLIASLLYGSGLRLMECLRWRVKDLDFTCHQITAREGKGSKDRVTMLPARLEPMLFEHLKGVKALHERDLREDYGKVALPYALEPKYLQASAEWGWQFVFPAPGRYRDP